MGGNILLLNMPMAGSAGVGIAHVRFSLQIEGKITFHVCRDYSSSSDNSIQ